MNDLDAYREKARAWLESVAPTYGKQAREGMTEDEDLAMGRAYQRAKFDAGFAGINWDPEFGGQGLTPLHKVIFEQEEMPFAMPSGYFGVSLGISVPVVMRFAQDREWAKERVLAALKGDEIWCQLFSEPSGGSDLAGIRTKAEPDGNGWKLNGQKLWTTWAQRSDYGVIIARNDPTVPKHKGLTFFWLDMHAPGVTVRPFRLAAGDSHVNEVFFDDVKLTDGQRLSPVGGGFGTAMATLMIERYSASDPAGFGPPLDLFVDLARECEVAGRPAIEDGRIRSAIARTYAMRSGLEAITTRAMRMMEAGMEPGPEGSLNKLVSVRSRQKLSELAIDLMGAIGLGWEQDAWLKDDWVASWLSAPTMRIAGGADEMLLNTIAEKILGLPQDHRPDKGIPFNQIPA
ncbi:MAG: acyl-CoA dehydrogenase family protein [Novosphingobium sp.]|nr:acyl-CoA dehydrogenase family protein [Novosphingobium sp.]MCP5403001.1 acyl-CoA dehydrogenase family protein [Novosphingobium sp.]